MFQTRIDIACFIGNQLFAHINKAVVLPFFPAPNLSLIFPLVGHTDNTGQGSRLDLLSSEATNPSGVITIESVSYLIQPEADGTTVLVLGHPQVANSALPISAFVDLMHEYYGFDKELY